MGGLSLMMMAEKIYLDRFDGKVDFSLCRRRMHAILVQQKVAKALEGEKKLPSCRRKEVEDDGIGVQLPRTTFE